MKFLIDAQLPSKLCEMLKELGLEAIHVDDLPKGDETPDSEISNYADQNELIVVTKDSDFYHSHMIVGRPGKLLLLTTGNIKNLRLFDLLRANAMTIKVLFETCNYIEMSNDSIIGH